MSLYQTPTSHSDSVPRPCCSWCGMQMMLARIDPETDDSEQRTFECFRCKRLESVVARSK